MKPQMIKHTIHAANFIKKHYDKDLTAAEQQQISVLIANNKMMGKTTTKEEIIKLLKITK
jgi:uncharacterized membrane protein